jgi:outer membrane protein OmpA-like peptidoglycan-associated protein
MATTTRPTAPEPVALPAGVYHVEVLAPGFLARAQRVEVREADRVPLVVVLMPAPRVPLVRVKDGELSLSRALEFPERRVGMPPAGAALVQALVDLVVREGIVRLRVEGHADGQEPQADLLAAARAKVLADALIAAGLPRERVESVGFGDTRPRAPNITSRGRQFNRRVELRLLTAGEAQ